MPEVTIKLPDIGEGIAEAEISEWHVQPGDWIAEDDVIGVVLTDKAAVEIPASVSGKVTWRAGEVGDMLAIGAPFVKIDAAHSSDTETEAAVPAKTSKAKDNKKNAEKPKKKHRTAKNTHPEPARDRPPAPVKTLAAAAVRKRAVDLGLDLSSITGSGPEGRVVHADLDRHIGGTRVIPAQDRVTETKVVGLRRKIAKQLSIANANIPAITIVEEIDVTELERLRAQMNTDRKTDGPDAQTRLTLLPFIICGVVRARDVAPEVNARYDDAKGKLSTHTAVHVGIATQTDRGLVVPVLRHAQNETLWDIAAGIERLATAARDSTLPLKDLGGSTITVTSLGPLGALASTPIINQPEVAIVGINRKQVRPLWDGRTFQPREMMNISASFDHRIVDGWDAATFVARLKQLLENPGLLFT